MSVMQPALSDHLRNLVQISYVTNDIDRAMGIFRDRYGIPKFLETGAVSVIMSAGEAAILKVAIAYVGPMQWEIVEPVSGGVERYRAALPADGRFAICFHHLGFRAANREAVGLLEQSLRNGGHPIPISGVFGKSAFFYADARERLGHHLEYVYYAPEYDAMLPYY